MGKSKATAPAPQMVDVRVIRSRGLTLGGANHPFGAGLCLPPNQAADLEAAGCVTSKPAAPSEPPADTPDPA